MASELERLQAELRRLQSDDHRATYCNHIGPAWTRRRIAVLEMEIRRVIESQ